MEKVDDRGFDGEVFEPVAGAALEDEIAKGEEFIFVLGVAATGHEVGEDDDVIGEVVVAVAVFPDFELDVDVASEVAEGCADAVPVARLHHRSWPRSAWRCRCRSHQTGLRCGELRLSREFCWCWMLSFF